MKCLITLVILGLMGTEMNSDKLTQNRRGFVSVQPIEEDRIIELRNER
jgi:hypothetical protein